MSEAQTLPGLSVKLTSSSNGFEDIQASATQTAIVGFEHVRSLLVNKPLRRRQPPMSTKPSKPKA